MSFYSEFAPYYEQIFPFRENVYTFLKRYTPKEGLILDAGCGTGHYCGRFSEDGNSIIGIDLDEQMISYAKNKYSKASFLTLDLLKIESISKKFSFVFSIGNVISHLSPDKLILFMSKLNEYLNDESYVVIQIVNWDFILQNSTYIFPDRVFEKDNVVFKRIYNPITEEEVKFNISLTKNEKVIFNEVSTLYPITKNVFQRISDECGFTLENHFSEYNLSEFALNKNSASIYVLKKI